jgi:ABC-2 type transport system ATP-binding protein
VRDLVRKFGDFTAVASTSFDVGRGEIFGLLGPNGAGKTTTFRMLCGLLPSTSGHLEVAGVNLRTARAEARRRIGYVSQKFALYGNLTVRENLEFFGGAYRLRGNALRQRVDAVVEQFGLEPSALSGLLPGGYKQRLAMAAGLIHEPEILFLDEPTSGIDPLARRAFWRTITGLAQGASPSSSRPISWKRPNTAIASPSRMPAACSRWAHRRPSVSKLAVTIASI